MIRDRIIAIVRYFLLLIFLLLLQQASGNLFALCLLLTVLLVPGVSWIANLYVRKTLRGKVDIRTTNAKNSACLGALRITNDGWLPAMKLYCRVSLINDLTRQEQQVDLHMGVGARRCESREFYMEGGHCGRVYISVQSLRLLDYFGLFSVSVPIKAAARLTILPDLFVCEASTGAMSAVDDESVAARRGDDRTEAFQMREYQSGDDIRQIHWKLSSKLDTLILREPSQSISRSLLVFWDKRAACTAACMDAMAEVVASVCHGFCESGTAFDLCWTEKNELEMRQIRDMDTLVQTIPALVTQAGEAECPEPDYEAYGRVLYISSRLPEESGDDHITYLLCDETAKEAENVITFSAEDYAEKLERLEI